MVLGLSSYIKVKCQMSGRDLIFLLDTGASISLVKRNVIYDDFPIDTNTISFISGIKKGFIRTLGLVNSDVLIDGCKLNHSFNVVDEEFPIPADGIMGLDFVRKFKCKIDFFKWKLTIRRNSSHGNMVIPIYDQPSADTCYYQNSFGIPARCEVVRRVTVTAEKSEVFVDNQEIQPGVFIGRTLIDKYNTYVRILNTNEENVIIQSPVIRAESLSDYDVYDPKVYEEKLQRNFPGFACDKLTALCKQYLDVFALATDKISVNNFYKQKLRLYRSKTIKKRELYIVW